MNTLTLDENLSRLALLFAAERVVMRRMGAWPAGIPYWDTKLAAGAHIWENAQHGSC